jgi:predicted nucleic acid-binding Zn ribbon protein
VTAVGLVTNGTTGQSCGVQDIRGSLRRQSLLVALVCVVCDASYIPIWRGQRACRQRCARILAGRTNKTRPLMLVAARAKKRAIARATVERMVARSYGELSVREVQLFNLGVRVGYKRGYHKGYHQTRKAAAA